MHFLIWNVTPATFSWVILVFIEVSQNASKMTVWNLQIQEIFTPVCFRALRGLKSRKKLLVSPKVRDENELPGKNNRHNMAVMHPLFLSGVY